MTDDRLKLSRRRFSALAGSGALSLIAGLEKRNRLLNPKERQVVAYHYGMARHHLFKGQTYSLLGRAAEATVS